jgi:glucokinase
MKYIGIDIGGTSVKLGIIEGVSVLAVHNVATIQRQVIADTIAGVNDLLLQAKLSLSDIAGIGVTLPGPVYANQVNFLPNIELERLDVYAAFQEAFEGIPLLLLNDANAAAIGEVSMLSTPVKDAVMLTIGTGLGSGIISNYQIVEGAWGQGGELGHVTMHSPYNFQCGCGKRDCAETILSAKGIRRLASTLKPKGATKITKSSNVKQLFNHAKQGDAFAITVVDEWANYMAQLILQVNVITNPSVIIFGGGVANAGEYLLARVQAAYDAAIVFPRDRNVRLRLATLGNDAGMIGAVQGFFTTNQ